MPSQQSEVGWAGLADATIWQRVILRGSFRGQPNQESQAGASGCLSCCQTTSGSVPYLKPLAFEKDKTHGLAKSLDGLGVEHLLAQLR